MSHPLISIVLCTFNGARFLEEQVESILNQTYPNIELLISDDASTDDTILILKKYEHHPQVKLFYNNQNKGFAKNFEDAAMLTEGKYISFSDQDDIWLPGKIEKLYTAIGTHSLVYSDSKLIDRNGMDLHRSLSDFRNMQDIYQSKGFAFLNPVSGHTMMAKRELLDYALPIPAGYYHDWWFAVQAANLNGVKYVNEQLTLYRQHSDSITKSLVDKKSDSRTYNKRYEDFKKDLRWIEILKSNSLEKERPFYSALYNLFALKEKNSFVWPLFWFLMRHQKDIFTFSKKKYLSRLFEARKLARGEKKYDEN